MSEPVPRGSLIRKNGRFLRTRFVREPSKRCAIPTVLLPQILHSIASRWVQYLEPAVGRAQISLPAGESCSRLDTVAFSTRIRITNSVKS